MNNNLLLRIKGKHYVNVYDNGDVYYSVNRRKLFTLKSNVLNKLESTLKLNLSHQVDSALGNIIRFNDGKTILSLQSGELFKSIWKIIYDANNIEENIPEVDGLIKDIEYILKFGDLLSEAPLEAPDPNSLIILLGIDVYTDSLINLILTKDNLIYY